MQILRIMNKIKNMVNKIGIIKDKIFALFTEFNKSTMKSIITNTLLLCLSIFFVGSMAQLSHYGPCPIVEPMKNFKINNVCKIFY